MVYETHDSCVFNRIQFHKDISINQYNSLLNICIFTKDFTKESVIKVVEINFYTNK